MAAATAPWMDSVYLFSSPVFSPTNSIFLGAFPQAQSLASGASYSQTVSPTLPNSVHGTYNVAVITDSSNNVQECLAQKNNVGVSSTSVSIPVTLYPDLKVTSVQLPASAYAGQNIAVTWVVTNEGTDTTGPTPWSDAIYLSLDQILDPNDTRLGSLGRPYGLAPGQSYTNTTIVTVPAGASGPYYLLVLADSAGNLFEHLGFNDSLGSSINPIVVTLPAPADLAATSVSISPNSGVPGTPITVNWTVMNLSSNSIPGVWTDDIYLSTNNVLDASAIRLASHDHNGLGGGNSYNDSFTGPLPALTPGTYYAILRTDVRDTVRESNLSNNTVASGATILIDVPTLVLGQPATNQIATGGAQYYKFSAPPGDTVRVTLLGSSSNSQNELFVRYGAVPDLGNYDFLYSNPFSPDQEIDIPTAASGFYYLMVRGGSEPDGPLQFTIEASLVPFAIASVSPTSLGDNGQVTITLTGARFEPGAAVSLVSGTNTYLPQTEFFVSGTTVQARFQFTNATHGTYNVVLANPDQQVATLPQAATIETASAPQAAAFNGPINLETRRGLPFRWNGYVQNLGNVDIPYLSAAVVTVPTFPVLLSAPQGAVVPDPNTPAYFYQNLAPGQALAFSFVVSNASSLGVTYYVIPTAFSRDGFLAEVSTEAETMRQLAITSTNSFAYTTTNTQGVVTTNSTAVPDFMAALLADPVAWGNFIAQGYAAAGILNSNDLAALPPPSAAVLALPNPFLALGFTGKDLVGCIEDCQANAQIDANAAFAAAVACIITASAGCLLAGPAAPACAAIADAGCLAAEVIAPGRHQCPSKCMY
jgi:hypothetical protein